MHNLRIEDGQNQRLLAQTYWQRKQEISLVDRYVSWTTVGRPWLEKLGFSSIFRFAVDITLAKNTRFRTINQ